MLSKNPGFIKPENPILVRFFKCKKSGNSDVIFVHEDRDAEKIKGYPNCLRSPIIERKTASREKSDFIIRYSTSTTNYSNEA